MFILTDTNSGGVYAIKDKNNVRTVNMFEHIDDANRYLDLLIANDHKDQLEIMEIDVDAVAINCEKFGYSYSIVKKDDLIIPPL